jgi:hypothetical protein
VGGLLSQVLDASGGGAKGERRRPTLLVVALHQVKAAARAHELGSRQPAQRLAKRARCRNDEGLELADRRAAGRDAGASRGQEDPQGLASPASPWACQMRAAEGLARRPERVEAVVLAAPACRAGGAIDLDHRLAQRPKERGEAGAVAAGLLDRPQPRRGRRAAGRLDQPLQPGRVGRIAELGTHRAGAIDHGGRVRLGVGVDADDMDEVLCQDGHAVFPSLIEHRVWRRPG